METSTQEEVQSAVNDLLDQKKVVFIAGAGTATSMGSNMASI